MSTVFVAGSITIKHLDFKVQERLMNIIERGHDVLVGDAEGIDSSIQSFLRDQHYDKVTVFCTGETPRNNLGNWRVRSVKTYHKPGTRAFFTAKDLAMAAAADTGFMIWDTKSTGTLSNVFELVREKKYAWVFINKDKVFHAVKRAHDVEILVNCMSTSARMKADTKIGLNERLIELQSHERQLALLNELASPRHATTEDAH